MRAAIFEEVGRPLSVTTVDDPQGRDGSVILKVAKAGICGSDLHWSITPGALAPGMIMGHEFSGTIVDVASTDAKLIGRRATALPMFSCWTCKDCVSGFAFSCNRGRLVGLTEPGAFAEYVAVDKRMIQLLPSGVGFEEGALIEPLAVAHHAVSTAGNVLDRHSLVIGAGPIGVAISLFLRHAGAKTVIASEPSSLRREKVRQLGATGVIDPTSQNVVRAFQEQAGKRPDIVVVAAGSPGLIKEAIDIVDKRGRVVVAGVCMESDYILPLTAIRKNVTVSFAGGYEASSFETIIKELDKGTLEVEPMVTHSLSLSELPDAFEALRVPTDQCKLLISID